jgi:8-oxo-dGTP diphosphatase/(d)CTP diphosphatase
MTQVNTQAAIRVVAGVIGQANQVLVAQRHPDKAYISWWEFPGGKVEADESDQQALARELKEELGVTVAVGAPIVETEYDYGDKRILLCSYWCTLAKGEPEALSHQAIHWSEPNRLDPAVFSAADRPLLVKLQADTQIVCEA